MKNIKMSKQVFLAMNEYELIEQEVNQRIDWAREWQARGVGIFAAGNIDAAYDTIEQFDARLYGHGQMDKLGIRKYFEERDRTKAVVQSLRAKLGKAIDDIAVIEVGDIVGSSALS
jgi:hypothetical protein